MSAKHLSRNFVAFFLVFNVFLVKLASSSTLKCFYSLATRQAKKSLLFYSTLGLIKAQTSITITGTTANMVLMNGLTRKSHVTDTINRQ